MRFELLHKEFMQLTPFRTSKTTRTLDANSKCYHVCLCETFMNVHYMSDSSENKSLMIVDGNGRCCVLGARRVLLIVVT